MPPLFTIITPSYNHGRFLGSTIESVLNQSFPDFRYILWDDGSPDDSWDLIRRYAERDSRILPRIHPGHANKGLCGTLQRALEQVETEYVAFLESDDLYARDFLAVMARCIREHPEAALLFCDVEPFGNKAIVDAHRGILERKRRFALNRRADKADLLFNTPVATFSSAVARTGALKAVVFDPSVRDELDHCVFTQLLSAGRTVYVDAKLVRWQKHEESYSIVSRHMDKYQSFRMRLDLCYPGLSGKERRLVDALLLQSHPRLEKILRKQARFFIKHLLRNRRGASPVLIMACSGRS